MQIPPELDRKKAIGKGIEFRDMVVDAETVSTAVGDSRRENVENKRREAIEQNRQKRGR